MKNILTIVLTFGIGMLLQQFLPWYTVALAGLLAVFLITPSHWSTAFAMGLLGGAFLWGGYSAYISTNNGHLLAERLGVTLGGLTPTMMIVVTALIGGIYAGLGAVCGYWTKKTFMRG